MTDKYEVEKGLLAYLALGLALAIVFAFLAVIENGARAVTPPPPPPPPPSNCMPFDCSSTP